MSRKKTKHLDIKELQTSFVYESTLGCLLRASDKREVGYLNNIGYRQVFFKGQIYSVHRLVWAIHFGEEPNGEIDHINGNRADNRIENLRLATSSENNRNRRLSSRNKSGVKGVFRVKWAKSDRWRVSVGHSHGQYYITHFKCFGEAVRHAKKMRASLHGEFANDGVTP